MNKCGPKAWTRREDLPDEPVRHVLGSETSYNREYYTDGSGGTRGQHKRMRGCGWGVVAIETELSNDDPLALCMYKPVPTHTLWGALGGQAQTVPRAELTACIELLAEITMDGTFTDLGELKIWSDSLYVVSRFNKGPRGRPPPRREGNHDLWERFWRLAALVPSLEIHKVTSHVDEDFLLLGTQTIQDTWGNTMADAAATAGARLNAIDEDRAKAIEGIDADTLVLLKRLLFINMLHIKIPPDPERGTAPSRAVGNAPTFGQLIRQSGHRTYYRDGRYRCVWNVPAPAGRQTSSVGSKPTVSHPRARRPPRGRSQRCS